VLMDLLRGLLFRSLIGHVSFDGVTLF
jgi:hypothetical protein